MALSEWYERTAAPLLGGHVPEVIVTVAVLALLLAFALSSVATLGAALLKSDF